MSCGANKISFWLKMMRRSFLMAKGQCATIAREFSTSSDNAGDAGTSPANSADIPDEGIKKSVFISQSHDIFTNLALEDWLYRHFDFTAHHVLMLWLNDPCVVIGRHQNP